MAGSRQSETYRATVATPFGVQHVRLRVAWRRRRHLTQIVMTLSTDGTPVGDLVAVVGIVPCSVVTTDGSVMRADHGGTSLMLEVGPNRRGGRSRHSAIVANVGPHDSPVTRVEMNRDARR